MKVLITGGAGFLGRRLVKKLLERGTLKGADDKDSSIDQIVLVDLVQGAPLPDKRVRHIVGDIGDPDFLKSTIDANTDSIFHLAAIVSGQAEADFDLGMRINVDASRHLLDICRGLGHRPKVVFASSVAVFGGELPAMVLDTTALTPQSSYGTQKAVIELFVNDYTRKGFIDGRVLRLPTISVRPGRPNAAASSFASSIIREPLNGEPAICPVNPNTRLWLLSPETVIESLVFGHDVAASALENRNINVPGLSLTVSDMVSALQRVAGDEVVNRIEWKADARIERIVSTWPGALDSRRALALGFPCDEDFEDVIRQHIRNERSDRR
ncbi:MAG: SDR family oxidoreductase [Anaerolineae bacterium]|nr:SDR family oxidoreductase [Phycisphaerae bacterium]